MKSTLFKAVILTATTTASLLSVSIPAQAAFYFEGLQPHIDAPNCNDAYATECGRYGQIPHDNSKTPKSAMPSEGVKNDVNPPVRHKTRGGLDK